MRLGRSIYSHLCCLVLFAGACLAPALAATYEVGPGKPLTSIGAVPWATLQAGDTVLIHWRSTPYKEKWVITRQGTAALPITVSGVPGPAGELPLIDGNGAVTAPGLNYWSEGRGVVKVGGSNTPPDTMPKYIVIENLEIINAHEPFTFSDDNGSTQSYGKNASAIYLEKGENITIRNCTFRNNGNGLFIASSDASVSRDILVQGNYLYDNGNLGSAFEHNSYTAGINIVFEYNRYGPPLSGSIGNNLKDRSAGTVVRYNWIEGGNRQLDLVDAEDSIQIRTDPKYSETHVYGNVLIEPAGAGNRQITHYGGDSGTTSAYRKGTLYFYNNTVVSTRTDRNTLFRLSTNDEHCDARNNVLYSVLPGGDWAMLDETGVLDLSHNWIKPGWINSFSGTFSGTVNNDGTMAQGSAPGFANEGGQEFSLDASSVNIDAGTTLNPSVLSAHNVTRQYLKHQAGQTRPADGTLDIGAYEFFFGGNQSPTADVSADVTSGPEPLTVNFDGTGSSDPDGTITAYDWDFGDGNTAGGSITNHVYTSAGNYSASLTVTDDAGASDTDTIQIVVDALPENQPPTASASANPVSGTVPLAVQFDGSGSSDTDGTIVSYEWDFGDGGSANGVAANHTYLAPGVYNATITVTDDDGDSSMDTVQIQVDPDVLATPVLSGSVSGSVTSLSWIHGGGADGFYVERGVKNKSSINWTRIVTLGGAASGYSDHPGRNTFYYRVQAFRTSPVEVSNYSNEIKLRVR